ncbi:coiled-coil domain-containing protein 157 [Aplysia californica]|uniref:Coiled-coil domain-containing protein 157 n=1 Tax=Aplysia californica TaxID=6500 RepID=A0ABM0KA87_APLCA|nr:coiled-coil domain-containing protein 157 [Aplysia californica]
MAYLLGRQDVMESLQSDVQDLQWTITQISSRVGPVAAQSWKFPDKMAGDLDIEDLLDLYDCSGESEEAEDRQVAHIALYELLIDRLLFCIQALSKFSVSHLGSHVSNGQADTAGVESMAGSVGLVVKEHWTHMSSLQTLYHQLQSENWSKNNKLLEYEKALGRSPPVAGHTATADPSSLRAPGEYSVIDTPGTLGLIPPNTSDKILMGLSSHNGELCISKDGYSKSTQTYETAFVPCESCDVVQKRMRESGDVVIKVCSDQGLPCSLKKFKGKVRHVELLPYGDVCHWMVEQNKDVARIGKQIEILQETINPLKTDLKGCEKRTRVAEEKAQSCEKTMKEEKEIQSVLRRQLESKMLEQEKRLQEEMWEEQRQKQLLQHTLEKQEKDLHSVKTQLQEREKVLEDIETEHTRLEKELAQKSKEVKRGVQLSEEVDRLRCQLSEVTTQLDSANKTLTREQGKAKSVRRHNESLQSKQEGLLSRMEVLGQENEELSQQVASLEDEKVAMEDKLAELKVETKQLRKKAKENEIIMKNLQKEKETLEESIKETGKSLADMEQQLREAADRERMIIEYPDLNGPVNSDLQGSGDIVQDMKNQVKANQIRIGVLADQNNGLNESIQKIACLQGTSGYHSRPVHTAVEPIPLWRQPSREAAAQGHREHSPPPYNAQNREAREEEEEGPPVVRQDAWTHRRKEERSKKKDPTPTPTTPPLPGPPVTALHQEFIVGRSHTPASHAHAHRRPESFSRQGRPSSGKASTVMAPVNATPIGAYTQMKQALGILSTKHSGKKGRPPSGRSRDRPGSHVTIPGSTSDGQNGWADGQSGRRDGQKGRADGQTESHSPFSCPKCDKMYLKSRDLDIHMTYCAT